MALKRFVGGSSGVWLDPGNWVDDQGQPTGLPGAGDEVEILNDCVLSSASVTVASLTVLAGGGCASFRLDGAAQLQVLGDLFVGCGPSSGELVLGWEAETIPVQAGRIRVTAAGAVFAYSGGALHLQSPLLQNLGVMSAGCSASGLQVTGDIENWGAIYNFQYNGGHIRGNFSGSIYGGVFRNDVHIDGDLVLQDWYPLNFSEATLYLRAELYLSSSCQGPPGFTAYLTGSRGRVIFGGWNIGAIMRAGRPGPILEV
jgi:hypothetical protein